MNVEITKTAKSLETVHTHTTGIYQSVFANEAKYKVETCNKTKVDFNMQKNELE